MLSSEFYVISFRKLLSSRYFCHRPSILFYRFRINKYRGAFRLYVSRNDNKANDDITKDNSENYDSSNIPLSNNDSNDSDSPSSTTPMVSASVVGSGSDAAVFELSTAKSVLSFIQSRNSNNNNMAPMKSNTNGVSSISGSTAGGNLIFSNDFSVSQTVSTGNPSQSSSSASATTTMTGGSSSGTTTTSVTKTMKKTMTKSSQTATGNLRQSGTKPSVSSSTTSAVTAPGINPPPMSTSSFIPSVSGVSASASANINMNPRSSSTMSTSYFANTMSLQDISLHPEEYSWQLNYDYLANNSLDAVALIPSAASVLGISSSSLTAATASGAGPYVQVIHTPTVGAVKGTNNIHYGNDNNPESSSGTATTTTTTGNPTIATASSSINGASRAQWLLSWWLNCKKWNLISDALQPLDNELAQIYNKYVTLSLHATNTHASSTSSSDAANGNTTHSHIDNDNTNMNSINTAVTATTTTPSVNITQMSYIQLLEKRLQYLQYQASLYLASSAASGSGNGAGGGMYSSRSNQHHNLNGNRNTKSSSSYSIYGNSKRINNQMYISNSTSATSVSAADQWQSLLASSVVTVATHSLTVKLEKYLLYKLNNIVSNHIARVICVGDVHGCVDELKDLIRHVSFAPGDLVLLLGDMVAKGPDSISVVVSYSRPLYYCVYINIYLLHI